MYYLQSRYYDTTVGRFINADQPELVIFNKDTPQSNMFAYCCNNTINFEDSDGFLSWTIKRSTLAFAIDITLTLVSAWAKYAYDLIGTALKLTVKPFLKKKGKKYILDILCGTVPKVISWASKFLTVVRIVIWRLGYIGLSGIISSVTNWITSKLNSWVNTLVRSGFKDIVDIVSCFFSTGGMVALMLDLFTDGHVNNKVKLI